jgi:Fic family protein
MFNKDLPYNDLPNLPPDPQVYETINVYRKLSEARAALAELKGRLPVIPNPLMLINTLVLQEAKDSSTIENIVTSNDKLFKAFSSSANTGDKHTREVLRYREALWHSYNLLSDTGKLDKPLIIEMFRLITGRDEEIRDEQVWIGNALGNVYTPPEPGTSLNRRLDDWLKFAGKKDDIDVLIRIAFLHYQFEAIHPFSDGNGRTGRILNVLLLCYYELLDLPVLYLSKFILKHKSDYYRLLKEVSSSGDWEPSILFILEGVKQTSVFTLNKVNAIFELFNTTIEDIKKNAGDIYSRELVEVIFSQPYCSIGIVVQKGIASRNTASKYLRRLEQIGVLASEPQAKETLYKNIKLYDLLSKS